LEKKRISYASFSQTLGINSVTFYNRYKSYGFTVSDLTNFLRVAKQMPPKMIRCLKCNKEFMPKAKSVKRAFCDECRMELKKKSEEADLLKFKYPPWVVSVRDWNIRSLVEQEYHIDEDTARQMSLAESVEEARAIRAERWDCTIQGMSSVVYDTLVEVKIG
jgi:hypothetical protein